MLDAYDILFADAKKHNVAGSGSVLDPISCDVPSPASRIAIDLDKDMSDFDPSGVRAYA